MAILLAHAAGAALYWRQGAVPPAAGLVTFASAITVAGFLLKPPVNMPMLRAAHGSFLWGLLLGAAFLIATLLSYSGEIDFTALASVMVAVILLSWLLDNIARLLSPPAGHPYAVRASTLLIVLPLAGTPIWLGPWLERYSEAAAFVNSVLAASPLSYVAVMADYDYLRSMWFYQYSPLGTLRYTYPDKLSYSVY